MQKVTNDAVLYDMFVNEYFALNPKGSPLQAWAYLLQQSQYGSTDAHGNPITVEALIISYKAYLLYWRRTFDSKDEKYISKDDRLADPETYVTQKMYTSLWTPTLTPRDAYLFGDHPQDYYDGKTAEFQEKLPSKK